MVTKSQTATSFALFLVGCGTKLDGKANIWPKMQIWGKFGRFVLVPKNQKTTRHIGFLVEDGTKWAGKANIWHKIAINDILGLNLAEFGPEFSLLGRCKTFGTSIWRTNETPLLS